MNQAEKEQTFFLDPKLFGFQIALSSANYVDRHALPGIVAEFGEVEALPFYLINRDLGPLAVDVKTQDQWHVHEGARGGDFAFLKRGVSTVGHEDAVAVGKSADVYAQFSGKQRGFAPDLTLYRSRRRYGWCFSA